MGSMAGRPSTYTPEIEAEIFERLAAGESLRAICQAEHLPSDFAVRNWVIQDKPPGISSRYAHARSMGLDSQAEEIIEIADTCRIGEKRKIIEGTRDKEGNIGPDQVEVTTGDMIERARLQVDARKWLLSKMRPDKYGDRTVLAGDKENPLEVNVGSVELLHSRISRIAERRRESGSTSGTD